MNPATGPSTLPVQMMRLQGWKLRNPADGILLTEATELSTR